VGAGLVVIAMIVAAVMASGTIVVSRMSLAVPVVMSVPMPVTAGWNTMIDNRYRIVGCGIVIRPRAEHRET
jgi:hypothetical protein